MSSEPFIANLRRILEKNGYPSKRVALPLERMYEAAYEKQLNFNKILDQLRDEGIDHTKTTDKIIFFPRASLDENLEESPDLSHMMSKAMEMMSQMSPEQLAELQKMVMGMSDTEKAELLQSLKNSPRT